MAKIWRRLRVASRAVLLGSALAALGPVAAAQAAERVLVQVGAVLATNSGDHVDAQLAGMRRQLQHLFHYSSYQLMKRENRDVGWGDPVDVEIPGGRFLRVMPKSVAADRVSLNVILRQDSRVLMDTEFTLSGTGTVMVGGPRHGDGVLIIWIGAQPIGAPAAAAGPQSAESASHMGEAR